MVKVLLRRLVSMVLRPEDVRDGQRHRDRPPQGPGRRRRAGRTTSTELTDLLLEDGRVVGVVVEHERHRHEVRARRGVILGSGGFETQPRAAREVPAPARPRSTGRPARQFNTGGGHPGRHRRRRRDRPARRRLVGPDDPAAQRPVVLPGRAQPARLDHRQPGRPALHERGAPVRRGRARDVQGRGDRRRPRADAGWSSTSATATATCSPGSRPRQPFPGRWYKHGTIKKAATLEELAAEIDVPAEALEATVDRFNGFAAHRRRRGLPPRRVAPTTSTTPTRR